MDQSGEGFDLGLTWQQHDLSSVSDTLCGCDALHVRDIATGLRTTQLRNVLMLHIADMNMA